MKKIKGVTLLEALVSLTLISSLVTGVVYLYVEKTKVTNSEIFGLEVLKYVKLVDEKVSISGYRADHWPTKNSNDFSGFKNFMYSNFNAVGTACGISNGWVPIVDRTNYETDQYKERPDTEKERLNEINDKELINCEYFNKEKFFLGLTPETRITVDDENKNINSVDFIFRYDTDEKLAENFIYMKKSLDYMKTQDVGNYFGNHYYTFVNVNDLDKDIKPLACFNLGENCGIKVSFRRSGNQDSIRTDGLNSIEDSIITFKVNDYDGTKKSDVAHGIMRSCDKWTYNNVTNSWTKNATYKCGVGMYENNLVAGLLDGTATTKTIYLNQQCNKFNIATPTNTGVLAGVPSSFINEYSTILEKDNKVLPCGIYEDENEYIVVSNEVHANEIKVGGELEDGTETSRIEVRPSEEMILEDYQAKLDYDANPPILAGDEAVLNPSKSDFKKPSRTVVEKLKDPSLSSSENQIREVTTRDLTVYEDLIVDSTSGLPPEEVFTTGELEVLNNFTSTQELAIDSNMALTPDQKIEAKRNLSYSSIKGKSNVAENLIGKKLVVGNDKLFDYNETEKEYTFKNNPINQAELDYKLSGSPVQIAERIKDITANKDVTVGDKSEANKDLSADTFQFIPNPDIIAEGSCEKEGVIGSDLDFELYICQKNKWESLIQDGGISAFNSATCPSGWRDYTEADGRSLIGTGYFDTLHAGIVRYQTGEIGGKAKHKLTIDEMPSHNHRRPIIENICSACHYNLGLAKIATGPGANWNRITQTGDQGGDKEHENRSPYIAVKFCLRGSDTPFDYIEAQLPNPNDVWVEYEKEEEDFIDSGAKYECTKDFQVDNISDPALPKTYEVEICKQDQSKSVRGREMNTRTYEIRYTNIDTYEYRTIFTQESWQDFDPFYTECEVKGPLYSCTEWTPDAEDIDYGLNFTKEKTCLRERVRYKQERRRNWINGQIKVVSQVEEVCNPPSEVIAYDNDVGEKVDEFRTAVNFSRSTPLRYFGGFRRELAGSYNIDTSASTVDYGNVGIPIQNEEGHTIMIKILRQERNVSQSFTCEVGLFAVNGNQMIDYSTGAGSTFNWIEGFKYLRFYNAANSQIGGTVTLGSTIVNGNYSYKINTNDVCSLTDTLYNNISSVKSISIDDI